MSDRCCNDCAWPELCAASRDCERRRRKEVRGISIAVVGTLHRAGDLPLNQADLIEFAHQVGPLSQRDIELLVCDKRDRRPVRRK